MEALNNDTDVPCIVQWRMLWCFASTSFNNDLLNHVLYFINTIKRSIWPSECPSLFLSGESARQDRLSWKSPGVEDGALHARMGVGTKKGDGVICGSDSTTDP